MTYGSIRYHARIARPADVVWRLVGDATRLHEWFPGIDSCVVEGTTRTITLGSGISMPEQMLVHDDLQRRFQYTITAPIFTYHRGTIDVLDLGDGTCVVVYQTDADPRTMALTISGGTAGALDRLTTIMESGAFDDTRGAD